MKRGEIYWADLLPRPGAEQTGRRPVVLVSHDGFNQTAAWKSLLVIPLSTSAAQSKRGPTIVDIPAGAGGLLKPSFALCHQVATLDRAKIGKRIGSLSAELLTRVNESLKAALDLD